MSSPVRIAFVGCGFVADHYARTLRHHPVLELAGATDRDPAAARRFCEHWASSRYESLEQVLDDESVALVVNLTSPVSHFDVTLACLEAGKHVYSEKPLALDPEQAARLVELAGERGLRLDAAPCSLLGEAAQTAWRAIRQGRVGTVRAVYAEMDDGPLRRMSYRTWKSESGAPWPYRSEFETGCTLEHAGYQVSWLAAFFGPAVAVSALSSLQVRDDPLEPPLEHPAPDFSAACIRFATGVVARLTCSIVAPRDHRLQIIGDEGVLTVADTWHNRSPVTLQRWVSVRRRTFLNPLKRRLPLAGQGNPRVGRRGASEIDFSRGVAELAHALVEGRASRLSAEFALHVNEVVLAIHAAGEQGSARKITSTFEPVEPMPWAVDAPASP